MRSSAFHVDMHRVGEAVAGMVTDRNLEQLPLGIKVAAHDPQYGRATLDAQILGDFGRRGDRLDILRYLADADPGEPFDLTEQSAGRQVKSDNCLVETVVKVGFCHGDWQFIAFMQTQAAKAGPIAHALLADLLDHRRRQGTATDTRIIYPRVARILQDLANVGERLMQRAAARCRRLDRGSRAALAGDQPFVLKAPQSFAYGEAANPIALAQFAFGGELISHSELTRKDFSPKFARDLQVARSLALCRQFGLIAQSMIPQSLGRAR